MNNYLIDNFYEKNYHFSKEEKEQLDHLYLINKLKIRYITSHKKNKYLDSIIDLFFL